MPSRFLNNITVNDEYTLPSADGTADQIIQTDGAGQLSFVDLSSIDGASSNFVYFDVKNETGSPILKGKGVMAVGTDGNSGHILIDEMVADGSVESKYFLGVLEEDIPNGGFARVISFGQLSQFDTRGQNGETWADGQILWCDPVNPGDFTITEPDGPNVKIASAFILNSSTNGKIQIRVQANEGIHDLHDTKITSQVDGDVLVWDNTTGVWFNDSTLNVDYANSKVGIGTTSPSRELDIDGNIQLSDPSFVATRGLYGSNGPIITYNGLNFDTQIAGGAIRINPAFQQMNFKVDGNNDFLSHDGSGGETIFSYQGSEKMRIDGSTGNVGIGTTNPGAKLEVVGQSGVIIDSGNSNTAELTLKGDGSSYGGGAQINVIGGSQDYLYYATNIKRSPSTFEAREKYEMFSHTWTWDGNMGGTAVQPYTSFDFKSQGSSQMTIYNNNVGIGTTSPGYKLDVAGDMNVGVNTGFNTTRLNFHQGFSYIEAATSFGSGYLSMNIGSGEIYLSSGGNVGVGTSSPSHKLQINGTTGIRNSMTSQPTYGYANVGAGDFVVGGNSIYPGVITLYNQDTTISAGQDLGVIQFVGKDDSSTGYTSSMIKGTAQLAAGSGSSGGGILSFLTTPGYGGVSERMRINNIGNVGIGTTSPGYKLDVNGTGRFTDTLYYSSLVQQSQTDTKKDIRLVGKENSTIPIKEYKYKTGDNDKVRYGVMAEDVESTYPELVETDADGIKGVKYIDLLVRKIAELETEKRTLVNWRHYHSNTSYNTLYDAGMTTAFPYAYGSIPAPYDMYFTSVTLVNNPYSSYNKGPLGDTATFQAYVNGVLAYEVRDIRYGQNPYESITADFGKNVRLKKGESLQVRFYANGIWRYCNSTIILTEV